MSSSFHFKKFTIHHDRSGMRVGTDGVLLGAWANVNDALNILDIGTGSGVIALMMAQRSNHNSIIDAVEIEDNAFEQATENARQSLWVDKIFVHHTAIQNFTAHRKYDLIISNPPYFQNSPKPPDEKRLQTRHTVTLSFLELIDAVNKHLNSNGRFNVILPYYEGLIFIDLAFKHNLFCTRKWSFRSRKEKPIERWLLEFSSQQLNQNEGEIILYESNNNWSEDYKSLTKDFYLKL